MRKAVLAVLSMTFLFTVTSLSFAGGSQEPAQKPRLVVYDYGHADEPVVILYKKLVDEYNARPDAKATLDYQFTPGEAYYPKLNSAIAAGSVPDIFSSHAGGVLASYATAGKAAALDDALGRDASWKGRFVAGAFDALTVDGKIYAVPTSQAVVPIFYNKEIFSKLGLKPPQTYDDLKGVIATLVNNGVVPFANGDKDVWVGAMLSEVVSNRVGGNSPYAAIAGGGSSWTDPSFVRAGKILQELAGLKAFPDNFLGIGYDEMIALFMGEKAAMCINGTWDLGRFTATDSPIKDKVGVMNFPTIPGGTGKNTDWLGNPDHNIALGSTNKSPSASIEFLKVWASETVQKTIGEDQGKIIVTRTTLDPSKVPAAANELNGMLQKMSGMFLFYDVGLGPTIGQEYNNTVQAMFAGTDPAAALAKLKDFTDSTRAQKK
jgi:raffinose/stachyose/melibiose transport system substrate-binding protein